MNSTIQSQLFDTRKTKHFLYSSKNDSYYIYIEIY